MSLEELKRQIWVLTNEKNSLQQRNDSIEHRLQEYITWGEQAQKILEENKIQIAKLTYDNNELSSKVSQGTVAMSQTLLDENSLIKRKLQEMEEQLENLNELINPLVMNNISRLDPSIKRKVIQVFTKGSKERQILALFIEDPIITFSIEKIIKTTGLSHLDCNSILKQFVHLDYLREIQKDIYQTVHAVGDKVVSTKDLSRVSIDVLHQHVKDQIKTSSDSKKHISDLEIYANELKRRNEANTTQEVFSLMGNIRMAKRSSEWIIDRLEEIVASPRVKKQYQAPKPVNSLSNPKNIVKPSQKTVPMTYSALQWKNFADKEVIEKVKLSINKKSDVNQVIEILTALKYHLESSVSGRVLYNINSMINTIKKYKIFDKDEIHEILYELTFHI